MSFLIGYDGSKVAYSYRGSVVKRYIALVKGSSRFSSQAVQDWCNVSEAIKEIELRQIRPNRLNPRLDINIEKLNELAESIKNVGLLEPLIVRPFENGYEVVIGERRYRASQQANLEKVPVIIRHFTDDEVIELNLIENVQREDLSGVEKGRCCRRLLKEYPEKYPTQDSIAKRIGVTKSTVSEWLRLVEAPEEIQRMVAPPEPMGRTLPEGKIDWKTAVTITQRVKEPKRQVEVAKELAMRPSLRRERRTIITKVAKEPERPVEEIIREVEEEPYELPFRLGHMEPIIKGIKTQTSRKGIPDPKVKVGATVHASVWEPQFADLRITSIERKRLSDFTEEDAKREGGYTLKEFKQVWKGIHGEWNENESVYVIQFERIK